MKLFLRLSISRSILDAFRTRICVFPSSIISKRDDGGRFHWAELLHSGTSQCRRLRYFSFSLQITNLYDFVHIRLASATAAF